ncbi:MotA/TolQ/ExbB proton channel family protein [Pseudomonadales bacterium]|jgi:biopolymer transport protein ExbB/TolQ|nr:MotA/TolQ/ExbB proton channel family protein [Pseudomonadales bacterium]
MFMNQIRKIFSENPILIDSLFLIFSSFLVHSVYVIYIDPISAAEIGNAITLGETPERTIWLILKDLEQELCLIFAIWCLFLLFNRYSVFNEDSRLISMDFLGLELPEKSLHTIDARLLEAEKLGLHSYLVSGTRVFLENLKDTQSAESARKEAALFLDLLEETLDSKLQLINFILWAIPSIGFLGTVRGIGQALADADQALAGDIASVALNLGIAFNSTFVALLLSLVLTFISSGFKGRDIDRLVKCKRFINEVLPKKVTVN